MGFWSWFLGVDAAQERAARAKDAVPDRAIRECEACDFCSKRRTLTCPTCSGVNVWHTHENDYGCVECGGFCAPIRDDGAVMNGFGEHGAPSVKRWAHDNH